jgi:hypothetical protein
LATWLRRGVVSPEGRQNAARPLLRPDSNQDIVERNRQVAHAFARRVINGVANRTGHPGDANLADAASRAARATHMSDGLVATHRSIEPKIA